MGIELQMSWRPSLLSQKRKNGPIGLRNLGNSCYLNSVLQCLTYTPPLANFCLNSQHSYICDLRSDGGRKRECPFCILEKRIVRSLISDSSLDSPLKILSCLRTFAEHFRGGRQEDAHEFLRYVIDACHNTCLRLKKLCRKGVVENGNGSGSTTIVKEIFGGTLQSQLKCLSCGNESNKVDEIMDISLDVLHSNSLKDAMQKFFQPEILDGSNKYKCENCKKLVAAKKQMSILQAPNILVIQLKRFEGIYGGKIDKLIAFEEVLVLSSFMCKTSQDPEPKYNLFGTIVHSGFSPESGHYYAYIKDAMGRWYCCNDSYVTVSTLQEVRSEKVYVLFFTRTNESPLSASTYIASNGVKSCESNSNETSKIAKSAFPLKVVTAKSSQNNSASTLFASNGVKSHECNGNEASKNPKSSLQLKAVHTSQNVENPPSKDFSATSKVNNKAPSSPRIKFSIVSNSTTKRVPRVSNGNSETCKGQCVEMNGNAKESVHTKENGKEISSIERNGFSENKKVDAVVSQNGQFCSKAIENNGACSVAINSVGTVLCESNNIQSRETTRMAANHHQFSNGSVNCSDISGFKRKSQEEDSCFLFARDANSQAKLEELKEVKEASSVLRSCGWYDKVYSFMRSRKRLCTQEAGNMPSGTDLKFYL
ncbi:ubiquitin carboxyl-terminal hydrolase 25 isoform X2 [Tripterygium wilfordii]|uniref:ubiquitin carboxyl-terminal hydrolase 25 isoform X2 n=1 Tax=Tripterygium wilfordii TaxID=458696 RepID=UPI0018F8287F|nr:ubiquitin carboxyl-terminal hydrolase 25 isoform X2 [Tripterygium wilfordii]